jgi:metallo-beta-lactamase family protein
MAGSGMCTGGRIKHHLVNNIGRPESTILFVGYQAVGTLGRQIIERPAEVRIFGQLRPLRARVEQIHSFSGHADRSALLRWLGHFQPPLPILFLTHGERAAARALSESLRREKGFDVVIPAYRDVQEI